MAHVFLSCSFYLALVVALAVCALFIRLIGATPDPEPDQRKRTKRNKLVQPKGMVLTRDRTKEHRSYVKNTIKYQMDNKGKPHRVISTGCSASVQKGSCSSWKELNQTWAKDLKPPSLASRSQTSPQLSPLTMFLLPESDKGPEAENSKELPSSKKRLYTTKLTEKLESKARKLN